MNREMTLDTEDESKVCGLSVPTKDQVIADVIKNWQSAYASAAVYTIPYVPEGSCIRQRTHMPIASS